MADDDVLAALDIGGTHVTATVVDTATWTARPDGVRRRQLRADGTAEEILSGIVACGRELGLPAAAWCGIAVPGPFDVARGVGLFRSVGKFDALYGVDVRGAVADGLGLARSRLCFVNDADAFLVGEWIAGAVSGHDRAAAITLGTGVGSAFLAHGKIIAAGNSVPPEGRVDLLMIDGRPLEETVSRRALLTAYGGGPDIDIRDMAERARSGEPEAQAVIDTAMRALGRALGPWLTRFGATALVVGGAISASWDLIEPPLRAGLAGACPALVAACRPELSPLIGAAWHCCRNIPPAGMPTEG
ncbi:ROK family protein [Micromonospora sp. DR5-3]|uniref:ROK family protein n=1 Tax=unclassified Micromonospora TaxID=2617518 RepID=UPI0011D9AED5|nr:MULTISPECIES: ROK family protein [unclassified Micromonospora]MCW3816029.1 ROK family protein [Micromonospora sp. DR5-3]TYC21291.1 ROK family protein [Micromonospora sp. MP36]